MSPLHHAIRKGNTDAVRALLEAGVDTNARDDDGCVPENLAPEYRDRTSSVGTPAATGHKGSVDGLSALRPRGKFSGGHEVQASYRGEQAASELHRSGQGWSRPVRTERWRTHEACNHRLLQRCGSERRHPFVGFRSVVGQGSNLFNSALMGATRQGWARGPIPMNVSLVLGRGGIRAETVERLGSPPGPGFLGRPRQVARPTPSVERRAPASMIRPPSHRGDHSEVTEVRKGRRIPSPDSRTPGGCGR